MKKDGNTHSMDSLEDVLSALGAKKPFLKEVESLPSGTRQPSTQSGAKAYRLLTDILCCVGVLCESEDAVFDMIATLDDIASKKM